MLIVNPKNLVDITYKEVMQMWNINKDCAVQRLNSIRNSLGKKRRHKLTVTQFCNAEDITPEEFYNKINQQ
jgi:hypothetical protein